MRASVESRLGTSSRPTWRGRIHLIALWFAVPLVVVMAIAADGTRARVAVVMYAFGLCSMLAVSTIYHRWVHSDRFRVAWRRADHATIFATIAGTFTGLALTTLEAGPATVMVVVAWVAAVAAALLKIAAARSGDRIDVVMYVAGGWTGVVLIPALWQQGGPLSVGLLVGGGIVYTVGAIGFRRRWPTLRSVTFSYHEVWHAFTVVAAALHFAAVWTVAT
jgi:hemolysin III